MSTTLDRTNRRPMRKAAALLAAAGALTLVACNRGGETETAVRDASIVLTTGSDADVAQRGSGSDSAVDYRVRRLEEALASLKPHVGNDSAAYAGAAAVLAAVAENGLAIEQEAEFVSQMRELDNRKTVLRGVLAQWWKHHAVAEASATFDPQGAVEELNRMSSMLEQDVEQVQRSKAALDERVAALDAQIAEAKTQGAAQRDEAARLQLETSRATPGERPAMAERVREHSRRADSYEFQAQRLETRAGQIRPDAEEKGKHIERLRRQLALLEESRQQIGDLERTSADDAAAARRAAREAETALFESAGALNDFLTNDLSDVASTCERRLRSATTHARDAGDSARDSGNLANASAQHRLGDLHASMGAAHASLGDLFTHLGTLSLENAARFTELGAARMASAEELRRSASDAYTSAASSLRKVRVRGEAKDALSALADRLEGVEPESLDEFGGDEPLDNLGDEALDPMGDDEGDELAPDSDDGG